MKEKKRKAIVMGATSGIGREVALRLASHGWLVGIAGRRTDRLVELENNTDGIIAHKTIDVTDASAPELLREMINEMHGIDMYFHSSGIGWQNDLLDPEKELKTVETNALGFVRMVDAAYNWFAQAAESQALGACRFRIACITSIAGTKGLGPAPAYSSTKRFQSHYLESLAQLGRMRRLPIDITDIRPGFVATDLIAGSSYPLQLRADSVAKSIVKAIDGGKSIVTIDWRYALLVAVWRLIPRRLWLSFFSLRKHPDIP